MLGWVEGVAGEQAEESFAPTCHAAAGGRADFDVAEEVGGVFAVVQEAVLLGGEFERVGDIGLVAVAEAGGESRVLHRRAMRRLLRSSTLGPDG